MRESHRILLCWGLADALVDQLRDAASSGSRTTLVLSAASVKELERLLECYPSAVLLYALPGQDEQEGLAKRPEWRVVRAAHTRCAQLRTIAVAISGTSSYAAVFQCAQQRLNGLLTARPRFDATELEQALRAVYRQAAVDTIWEALTASLAAPLSAPAESLMRRTLRVAHAPVTLPDLAIACQMHERSLRKYCHRHELPEPQRMIAWARLMHVAREFDLGTSADDVWIELGFPSSDSVRKLVSRMLSLRLTELRGTPSLPLVCRRLEAELCGESYHCSRRQLLLR